MAITTPCFFWGIDPVVEQDLKKAGMEVLAYPNVPKLAGGGNQMLSDWATLSRYNILVFGDTAYSTAQMDPNTGKAPDNIRNQIPLMKRFLKEGGGIWFCGLGEYDWGAGANLMNYILKELNLGAEVAGEVAADPSAAPAQPMVCDMVGNYAWTDVSPDPLTQCVQNLLHPSGVLASWGTMGVIPIVKLSPEWRVLVKGKPTAASFAVDRRNPEGKTLISTPGAVKTAPVLVAARQVGKGRVVLWPTWSLFTVTAGSGGLMVDSEKDGKTSDGARLVENLLCWLAEPSQGSKTVGVFDPAVAVKAVKERKSASDAFLENFCKLGRQTYARQFRGMIGAHSTLSDGSSSPEEMIAAAKKAGYAWLAFTENFAKMDEGKWKQLLAVCDKVNQGDAAFRAYPGLDFLDEAGNRGVVFGHRYWVKDNVRSKKDPSRIKYWKGFTYDADADPSHWPPRVIIRSKTNNKRPWNQGLYTFFATYSYEGGKLIDDSLDEYSPLVHRYRYIGTGIMAVHTSYSAEQVAAAAQPGLWQTVVRAHNLDGVLSELTGIYNGRISPFSCYISQTRGPEIVSVQACGYVGLEFKNSGVVDEVDLAIPGNRNIKLHVRARAQAGLSTVEVFHNNRLAARISVEGQEFEKYLTFSSDVTHSFHVIVTDRDGHRAVSWPTWTLPTALRYVRCGDNQNLMLNGVMYGTLSPLKIPYHASETTTGWTPRSDDTSKPKRPAYGSPSALSSAAGDTIHGSAINARQVLVDGQPWERVGDAFAPDFDTQGRYGMVITDRPMLNMPGGCMANWVRAVPSPWPMEKEQWIPFLKPDGANISRYRNKVTFARTVTTKSGEPLHLQIGCTVNLLAGTLEVMSPDGSVRRQDVGDQPVTVDVPQGGFVCWYDDRGDGVGGLIALTPGIQCYYTRQYQQLFVPVSTPIRPGTEVGWDVIFVSGNISTTNSDAQMLDVWRGMGIAGKPTLYSVKPSVGKVVDEKFFLTLQSKDGGFSGRIAKTGGKELPIHLPVFINGLNPRWDAGLWYRGEARLHTVRRYQDRWGMSIWIAPSLAVYEARTNEIRHLPVFDSGVGYCQVETDKQDPDVFIGNFLVCDRPEIFLTLLKAEKGACTFEINNPTDCALTVTVRPAKGFEYTGNWSRKIVMPAGDWQTVNVAAE